MEEGFLFFCMRFRYKVIVDLVLDFGVRPCVLVGFPTHVRSASGEGIVVG